jgi:hypothetical protein
MTRQYTYKQLDGIRFLSVSRHAVRIVESYFWSYTSSAPLGQVSYREIATRQDPSRPSRFRLLSHLSLDTWQSCIPGLKLDGISVADVVYESKGERSTCRTFNDRMTNDKAKGSGACDDLACGAGCGSAGDQDIVALADHFFQGSF